MGGRHVHLDPVGGVAGDMFAAALLDAFPEREGAALAVAHTLAGARATVTLSREPVGGFSGARLIVEAAPERHHRGLADLLALFEGCEAPGGPSRPTSRPGSRRPRRPSTACPSRRSTSTRSGRSTRSRTSPWRGS